MHYIQDKRMLCLSIDAYGGLHSFIWEAGIQNLSMQVET